MGRGIAEPKQLMLVTRRPFNSKPVQFKVIKLWIADSLFNSLPGPLRERPSSVLAAMLPLPRNHSLRVSLLTVPLLSLIHI